MRMRSLYDREPESSRTNPFARQSALRDDIEGHVQERNWYLNMDGTPLSTHCKRNELFRRTTRAPVPPTTGGSTTQAARNISPASKPGGSFDCGVAVEETPRKESLVRGKAPKETVRRERREGLGADNYCASN